MKKRTDEVVTEGILSQIRYHQSDFFIGKLADGTSVKGPMMSPQAGLKYKFTGRWDHHPTWGKTFIFSNHETSLPTNAEAVRLYLESNAKWVGPEISKRIIETFGDSSLEILKNDPQRAAKEINGITMERASEISAMLKQLEENEHLEIALNTVFAGARVNRKVFHKIIRLWGNESPQIIRANPYLLIEAVEGVGFLTADEIARKNGYESTGFPRVAAGVTFVLNQEAWSSGHVCLPKEILLQKTQELLCISKDIVSTALEKMAEQNTIAFRGKDVYLKGLYRDENFVAGKIKTLISNARRPQHESVS